VRSAPGRPSRTRPPATRAQGRRSRVTGHGPGCEYPPSGHPAAAVVRGLTIGPWLAVGSSGSRTTGWPGTSGARLIVNPWFRATDGDNDAGR